MTLPELEGETDTEKFISLLLEFWNIVNVHKVGLDLRTVNPVRSVINTKEDTNFYLKKLKQGTRHSVNVRGESHGCPTYENIYNANEMFL